jgi:excisionase family DNA binding protein
MRASLRDGGAVKSKQVKAQKGSIELLTVAEVARELKLTEKAVRNLIYAGKLTAYSMAGRRIRVTRADLDTFLQTELRPA